ncbi:MAG: hypothetical protein RH948_07035 [Cyclobacteriaceae bacterium]
MQIIYLVIDGSSVGVTKKLADKIKFIKAEGIDIELACTVSGPLVRKSDGYINIPVDNRISVFLGGKRIWWRLSVFVQQWEIYRAINRFLKKRKFEIILFRYPVADFFLWRLSITYRNKIVYEHNTIEIEEIGLRKTDSLWFKYFYYSEMWFGSSVRRLAKGLVGVTHEITRWQANKIKGTTRTVTISNGIDVNRLRVRANNPFDGSSLNLLFLAGSESPWHGIDKLINSVNRYTGDCDVHCYVAGNIDTKSKSKIQANQRFTLLPNQEGKELDDLFDKCHIGIGSLGMANFLKEACPLKTREYWSRGLPFVVGYLDVDLVGNDDMKSFYLRLNIENDNHFKIEDVIVFANKIYGVTSFSVNMRNLAMKSIHYQVKAKKYASFFNSLME